MRTSSLCAKIAFAVMALGTAVPGYSQVKRYISVDSHCSKPLRLYISHADGYRNWHVHGPYNFKAYEGPTRLVHNGVTLTQSENHDLYLYAESLDGSSLWQGSHSFEYEGVIFNMMKGAISIVDSQLRLDLTC